MRFTRSIFVSFAVTMLAFLIVDAGWLALVAVEKFQAQLGPLLRSTPNYLAAAVFYPLYAAGLFVLAVQPALAQRSIATAAARGAVLGLTAYGTFDLTNLAIINGWTAGLAAMDMAWGTFVSALAAVAGYLAGARARDLSSDGPDRS